MELLILFWEFFKIGLFAVGGGAATLPFLMDLTEKFDWYTMNELTNMIAISESTPGPLGLNMSTYAGYQAEGFLGGIIASIGLVFPSVIIIVLIAKFLANYSENKYVKAAFEGIRPAVTALIASAVANLFWVSLFQETETGYTPEIGSMIVFIIVFGLLQVKKMKKMHPVIWFLVGALVGVIFQF